VNQRTVFTDGRTDRTQHRDASPQEKKDLLPLGADPFFIITYLLLTCSQNLSDEVGPGHGVLYNRNEKNTLQAPVS
jgi:hypothetical protein